MNRILVLNGPNLNLLGTREPGMYGSTTLDEINQNLSKQARSAGASIDFFQSNSEAALIDRIQMAQSDGTQFIIINAGALTHTSVGLRDALVAVSLPFIEVHISNVFARETFRRHSYLSDVALGIIAGLGVRGYQLALDYALSRSADAPIVSPKHG